MESKLDTIAEKYGHNYFVMQDTHYNGLKQGFKAGVKESVKLIDWDKIEKEFFKRETWENIIIKNSSIVEWFKKQIEKQIKEL